MVMMFAKSLTTASMTGILYGHLMATVLLLLAIVMATTRFIRWICMVMMFAKSLTMALMTGTRYGLLTVLTSLSRRIETVSMSIMWRALGMPQHSPSRKERRLA